VDQKSNEITAVPKVLELLDLKGTVVTADALITQTAIAAQIVKGGGDYLLAVKDNHPPPRRQRRGANQPALLHRQPAQRQR